jgi:hypothetical protein
MNCEPTMIDLHAGAPTSMLDRQAKMMGLFGPSSVIGQMEAVNRHAKKMESIIDRSSVLGQVESMLGQQARLMEPFKGMQSGLAGSFGKSFMPGLQSKFEAALGPSFFSELKATTLMADAQAKTMQMAYGPRFMREQQTKLMDPFGQASIAVRGRTPEAVPGAVNATGRTTDHGLVVLDGEESSQFLEWLRSRSPSLAEVKMICEWLHLVEALITAIMYYALHETDSIDPGISLVFALMPVALSAAAKRLR